MKWFPREIGAVVGEELHNFYVHRFRQHQMEKNYLLSLLLGALFDLNILLLLLLYIHYNSSTLTHTTPQKGNLNLTIENYKTVCSFA